jgi:glycine/D-amino acid oxidase-like deaminating enzyme
VPERYDVILVGGGIIGSSTAMALATRGLKVAVADIDLSGPPQFQRKERRRRSRDLVAAGKHQVVPGFD